MRNSCPVSPLRLTLALAVPGTVVAGADAQQVVEASRPAFKFLRFEEDWSGFKDVTSDQTGEMWDDIKNVPLSDDGEVWASFGGHMRVRLEDWSSFAFGAPANDDETFLLWRLAMHADIHVGESVRVFVEGKSALSTDRDLPGGHRTLDVDSLALEQAFVDSNMKLGADSTLTLRAGRQQLAFGKQRLVSPLPWGNTLRRWDGVSAIVNTGSWKLHGFWTQFAPTDKYSFNESDGQTPFYGVYATTRLADSGYGLDAYFLGLEREDQISFNGTTGEEERYTLGGRLFGPIAETNLDFDAEAAYQFGEVGSGDVSAFMFGGELGCRMPDWWGNPRFTLGFDYASGDKRSGGDVETFNQLFPLGHAYLGYMDFVGRQNIMDVSGGVSFTPGEKMTMGIAGHLLRRSSDDDGLYNAGGQLVRAGSLGSSSEVGAEIDLTLKYVFNRHCVGLLGYSHFFAGDFIDQSGSDDDMDFVHLSLTYTF
jgi:hypothetical protein